VPYFDYASPVPHCLLFLSLMLSVIAILTSGSSMIRWLHADRHWTQEVRVIVAISIAPTDINMISNLSQATASCGSTCCQLSPPCSSSPGPYIVSYLVSCSIIRGSLWFLMLFHPSDVDNRFFLSKRDLSCRHCGLAGRIRRQHWDNIDGNYVEVCGKPRSR
jgi:hypothetical protein